MVCALFPCCLFGCINFLLVLSIFLISSEPRIPPSLKAQQHEKPPECTRTWPSSSGVFACGRQLVPSSLLFLFSERVPYVVRPPCLVHMGRMCDILHSVDMGPCCLMPIRPAACSFCTSCNAFLGIQSADSNLPTLPCQFFP